VTPQSQVPVDLLNPGQVFACLGLMEMTEVLCGPCEGEFACHGRDPMAEFRFRADDEPLAAVLDFLCETELCALAPRGSRLVAKEPGITTQVRADAFFPSPAPDSPSALPIRLNHGGASVSVEHWADGSTRDNVKFWAGAGGYSGAALARDALEAIRGLSEERWVEARRAPFDIGVPMSSSFRFDWRRDYVPLDLGFSINEHSGTIQSTGYPFVELLAAIGLEFARPVRVSPRSKLAYRYGVWHVPLPTLLARPVLGGASPGVQIRRFRLRLDWPGQENQARCIVDVQEE